MDAIWLDLDVSCIVGILPRERREPQALRIHLRTELDLESAGSTGVLASSVDYAAIDTQLRFLVTEGRFLLLESMALAVLRTTLLVPAAGETRAAVRRALVRIAKPQVMTAAVPGVELERDERWAAVPSEPVAGGGTSERILSVPEVTVRRLCLPAGSGVSDGAVLGIAGQAMGRLETPVRLDAPGVLLVVHTNDGRGRR